MKLRPALLLAAALVPTAARAGNGDLPRTPMIHLGERCLTVVDRSVDPVVHLEYTIPNVDICLTADEPADSRTHQVVAFCHGDPVARIIPHWHTRAEADASVGPDPLACAVDGDCAADLRCIAGGCAVPASDVLAEHPDYADCWTSVVAPAQRRRITCDVARTGIDWDTTGLARGAYTLRGYTYEPPQNSWSPRLGLFKVVDGPDPADAPPAVGFGHGDTVYLWKNQPMTVRLCVDAMDGSTVSLAHAVSVGEADPQPAWTTFLADEPVTSGSVAIEFLPPEAAAGQFLTLRAQIVDPKDRTVTAFMQAEVKVEVVEDPSAAQTTGDTDTDTDTDTDDPASTGFPERYDFCADNPDADKPPECPELPVDEVPPEAGGCCSIDAAPGPAALLILLAVRRRRRTAPAN